MKELILENPPRKKGKKRRTAAQRRATAKMIAAARAKRRGKKSSKRKSSKRSTKKTYSVKRRTNRKSTKSMARKSRKSTRRRKASRRRKTRTFLVRGSATPIKLNGMLGGVFSKDNLTVAGGAVAATVVTNFALGSTVAQKLPGLANPYARAAYMMLVPVIGGMVTKRFSPNLAKGMVIGGLANGIAQLITASKIGPAGLAVPTVTTTATGEYLGEYLGGYDSDDSYLGEYLGEDIDDSYMGEYLGEDVGSVGAFEDSAW